MTETHRSPTRAAYKLAAIATLALFSAVAQAQTIAERNFRFGYVQAPTHPTGVGEAKFAEVAAAKSGGKFKIKGYSDGQLGGEVQMISAMQGGVLEMAAIATAPLVGVVKEYALLDFPFLFRTTREADAVLDGPIGSQLLDKFQVKNLVGVCYWENGFRQMTNNKRPITKMEDIEGLKIRTMQSPVFVQVFNQLGANAIPMAFTELYSALETHAVDAQENPYAIISTTKFNEVQKYLTASRHVYSAQVVLVSKKVWDGLSGDEKRVLKTACSESRDYQRRYSREQDAKILEELKGKGMVFNELPPSELARIQQRVQPVLDKYAKDIGEDLVKQTYAQVQQVRAQK